MGRLIAYLTGPLITGPTALRAALIATIISIITTAGVVVYTHTQEFHPVSGLRLGIGEGQMLKPGESFDVHLEGCVDRDDVPLVLLTMFSSRTHPEALVGPAAIALADEGCNAIDSKAIVPPRATTGEWRMILIAFAEGPEGAQTVLVTSPPFNVSE